MRIWIANESSQTTGGGWTFIRNFQKGMGRLGVSFVDKWQDADIVFIAGATMFTKETLKQVKDAGKKIVLRVDNIPKNSANRNCGTSRLKACADAAQLVIYQSQWARKLLKDFLEKDGEVIYNGADTDIFRPPKEPVTTPSFVYSRFGRGETKGWDLAWYAFQDIHKLNPEATLTVVGKFSPEQIEYGFDFFNGERVRYRGIIEEPMLWADILRSSHVLLAPYAADACSNTVIEARLCGCEVETLGIAKLTFPLNGGTQELLDLPLDQLSLDVMCKNYLEILKTL